MTHPAPATLAERLRQGIDPTDIPDAEREMDKAADRIEKMEAAIRTTLCPGGGYNGQPHDEAPTVENCLKAGVCGCDLGDALR